VTKVHEIEVQQRLTMRLRARCETDGCGRTWTYSKRTLKVAKDHARAKGHEVAIIEETITVWAPAS
jgi:hypothetical protein